MQPKSYDKQTELQDEVMKWIENNEINDMSLAINPNSKTLVSTKEPFYVNGSDFNWNYQYRFSSLALLSEPNHLVSSLFRDTNSNVSFMAATTYRLLTPITPITFIELNFNPNISFYVERPGISFGNRSITILSNVIRHDIKSNTKTIIAQSFQVFVNTAVNHYKHAKRPPIKDIDVKRSMEIEKSKMRQFNEYINSKAEQKGIYSKEFRIDYGQLDQNFHVNQSIFLQVIENCLYEYDNEFFNGYWNIQEITCNYRKELKLDEINGKYVSSIGKVVILETNLMGNEKRYIGIITHHDAICTTFQCIVVRSAKSKL